MNTPTNQTVAFDRLVDRAHRAADAVRAFLAALTTDHTDDANQLLCGDDDD